MVLRPGRAALEEAQAEKVLSCPPLAQKPPLAQAPPKPVWPLTPSSFSASTLASVFPFRFILPCTPSPAPSQAREQPVPARGARLPAGALAAAPSAAGAVSSITTTQDSARRAGCAVGRNMKVDFGGAGRGRSSQRVRAAVRPRPPPCGRSRGRMEGVSIGVGGVAGVGGLTWKAAFAQPRKASSWPQSSSPWPSCSSRSPPSSSSRVSTARAKAQKWGYAREPSPNTQNLGCQEASGRAPSSSPRCPGSSPPLHPPTPSRAPLAEAPDLRVPSAPALSVLLDSFLFRRQEDTSGSEQETLLKRIL